MDLTALKKKLVMGCRIMHHEKLVQSVGHLSVRVPGTDTFLISPRRSAGFCTADQVLLMDIEGRVLEGKSQPNSEWPIHSEVYRARPDVGAVAHVHPLYAIVLGNLEGETFKPLHNQGTMFVKGVGHFDEVLYIRNKDEGARMAQALGDKRAMFLRAHGATVVGASIEEAIITSIKFEYNCQLQIMAMAAGKPRYMTSDELQEFTPNPPRMWEYYVARVQGKLDQPLPEEEL